MDVIGFAFDEQGVKDFYPADEFAALQAKADVRLLGHYDAADFFERAKDVTILSGAWDMPQLTPEILAKLPHLRAIAYAAGTVKYFVTPESYARGIRVTTAMHANAIPVAETTAALLTLVNKNWFGCQDAIREDGNFDRSEEIKGFGNYQVKVGLIGYGAIVRELLPRLDHMVFDIMVYDPYVDDQVLRDVGVEPVNDLLEIARRSEIVSLHAPNIPETQQMCSAAFFNAMQDGATFINTARGALVNEDDLVAALKTGRISALLDVTWPEPPEPGHPFYSLPNCWLTPHLAGSTGRELRRMGSFALKEIDALLDDQPLHYEVTEDMLARMA